MVDTTSTTLGGTISNEIINDLPLNAAITRIFSRCARHFHLPGRRPLDPDDQRHRPEDTSFIVDGVTDDEHLWVLA